MKRVHSPGSAALLAGSALMLSACALSSTGSGDETIGAPRKETVLALTQRHELIRVNAGQPQRVLSRVALRGLAPGEELLGIDFRVARGVLYALGSSGRLYTVDATSGQLSAVGAVTVAQPLPPGRLGFDFNPAADRIRIVSESGLNLRTHPDTGERVDGDPKTAGWQPDAHLAYAAGDPMQGRTPRVTAAAYTYNKQDEKLTTNFAIDLAAGQLVMQGSAEGAAPVVSPNSGQLRSVGSLGVADLRDASFDVADVDNTALAALRTDRTRLYRIDLASGRATSLGTIADGQSLRGLAIEP